MILLEPGRGHGGSNTPPEPRDRTMSCRTDPAATAAARSPSEVDRRGRRRLRFRDRPPHGRHRQRFDTDSCGSSCPPFCPSLPTHVARILARINALFFVLIIRVNRYQRYKTRLRADINGIQLILPGDNPRVSFRVSALKLQFTRTATRRSGRRGRRATRGRARQRSRRRPRPRRQRPSSRRRA